MTTLNTEQVWHRFSDALRGYIARRVADPHRVDDVLQDTFVRIHRGIASLSDAQRLAPWVYRITRNTIADHGRQRGGADALRHDPAEPGADKDDEATLTDEIAACAAGWLADVPEPQRRAVELVDVRGRTHAQAANELGLSVSGVKSRVQRGRHYLRQLLHQCCELEFDRFGKPIGWRARRGCDSCGDETLAPGSARGRVPKPPGKARG